MNFQMFKLNLEKAEEPEIKLPTSAGSSKQQESSRKTSISAFLTMPKPLTVWRSEVRSLSHVQLFGTPWTVACQAPLSMGFSRQEYWSVLPFPSPGDLPDPGIEPRSLALEADALTSEPPGKAFDCVDDKNCGKFFKRWVYQTTWPASWDICMQVKKQ